MNVQKRDNVDLVFKVIFAVLGFLFAWIFTNLTGKVDSMAKNINELNQNVAVILHANSSITNSIEDFEERIRVIEKEGIKDRWTKEDDREVMRNLTNSIDSRLKQLEGSK